MDWAARAGLAAFSTTKKIIFSIQVFRHYCLNEDPDLAASRAHCVFYSSSTILRKESWEYHWKNESAAARVSRWCCEEFAKRDPPAHTELFHAQNERAGWTKSRVITLIDTLPPGSLWRANQGWMASAGSQAQVWPVLSSFSVIVPWQSAPISSLAKQLRVTCSAINPTVPSGEIRVWKEKGLSDTLIPVSEQRLSPLPLGLLTS